MFDSQTLQLLRNKLPRLPHLVAEKTLAKDIDELVAGVLPKMTLAVVSDANTREFGDRICRALSARTAVTTITLDLPAHADDKTVSLIRERSAGCDALVAVGSGTINDLCKHASNLDKKPYIVFPTAASMNGYCSANASITVGGYKKTVAAHMPEAVFADLSVIAAAPARLSKSGLGDSLARPTAQADWLMSHHLLGTPYDETPFALLAPLEAELLANARGIRLSDPDSIAQLFKTLILSGLGMTIAGGSYPASQAEHMIAHAYNMFLDANRHVHPELQSPETLHGEEIAVTSLAMARRQEVLLGMEPALLPTQFPGEQIGALYGAKVAAEAEKSYALKQKLIESVHKPEKSVFAGWEALAEKVSRIHIPPSKLQSVLAAAECPSEPEHLGWNRNAYMAVSGNARFLRERFTFLDLT